ncbi:MAG: S9 family peptidase [Proteobacteria bacterium]|nr:S9 family peptidase [Pseudomonadota bacterium]
MRLNKLVLTIFGMALLGGCAVAPTHPSLNDEALPPLVPVRDFVANVEGTGNYRISPDGRLLAWKGVSNLKPAVWVKTLAGGDMRAIPIRAAGVVWSGDSRFLFLTVDATGDENTHVFAVDLQQGDWRPVDLTPFKGAKSNLVRRVAGSPAVIVTSNQRDKKVFDLYRIDPTTGQQALMAQNPGNVWSWVVDREGRLRARSVKDDDGGYLQLREGEAWRTTIRWGKTDNWWIADFIPGGNSAWAVSNRGRDRQALVRIDLETGAEQVVHEDAAVDVEEVLMSQRAQAPLMAHSMPGYSSAKVFDAALAARLAPLQGGDPAAVYVGSLSDDEQSMTVNVGTDQGWKFYLLANASASPVLLGESNTDDVASSLGKTQPISYAARDGLAISGYLTLPPGVRQRPLPLVLLVHGGPWARDRWTYQSTNRSMQQFLANRGYAVLQVNYRGSSGYGRAFMEKAVGEFAGKMHDDLVDGVRWAVAQGIADPKHVGIYGASYGGYSALVGATITPEVFACAVDVVGIADLASWFEETPPYWELGKSWWARYVGDPADAAQRKLMDAKSPINHVANARNPILIMHGVNDPRVRLSQSQRMVNALRSQGKQVEFVAFQDDGHGNRKWTNNLTMYRQTEDFFAGCLGGRSSGFDYYQLGAWAF